MKVSLENILSTRNQYVLFFLAGAGLEVFMNLFHVGEANIYRSIRKSLSTSRAEEQFEAEKRIYERIVEGAE